MKSKTTKIKTTKRKTKKNKTDAEIIVELGIKTFWESHGHSASKEDVEDFVSKAYTPEIIQEELSNPNYIYHIVYYDQIPVGFFLRQLFTPHPQMKDEHLTKLDRIYVLKDYYGKGLGKALFNFIVDYSKINKQIGIWLFVWIENHRAVQFYKSSGFQNVGSHDYRISATHSNPNHIMLLQY